MEFMIAACILLSVARQALSDVPIDDYDGSQFGNYAFRPKGVYNQYEGTYDNFGFNYGKTVPQYYPYELYYNRIPQHFYNYGINDDGWKKDIYSYKDHGFGYPDGRYYGSRAYPKTAFFKRK